MSANRAPGTVWCTFCWPDLPKLLRTCQPLTIFLWSRTLATVWCAFCRPHLLKVLRKWQFFQRFEVQIDLPLQSCALFVDNCPRSRPATAETETLRHQKPHYPRKQRFAHKSVFTPEFTRFRTVTLLYCSTRELLLQTMWCTWWQDCPGQSSVTGKFSNQMSFDNKCGAVTNLPDFLIYIIS